MAEQSGHRLFIKDKLQPIIIVILVILIINTGMIALGYFFMFDRIRSSDTIFTDKQKLAQDLSEYNHRLANEHDVYDRASVREVLAEYNYLADQAVSSDELLHIIFNQGRKVQDVIFREADLRLKEKVLIAVNNDSRVQGTIDITHLVIRLSNGQIGIYPDQYLETITAQQIKDILSQNRYQSIQSIDIEVKDGVGRLIQPQTAEEQIRVLNEDLNTLRSSLYELRVQSGLAEMVGPGVTLYIYDAEETAGSVSLVHDADIRDIVNEIFSAGARGISVGDQRLTTTSSIRCSGPLIMVNYRQIPTNPVVIQAVGDPDLLISGLNIILSELERKRGLVFEINYSGFIKLPAYVGID